MQQIKSLCVYCSASVHIKKEFFDLAHQFGQLLAAEGIRLVYGGGKVGLMGKVADSCMQAGGEVLGISTDHLENYEQAHDQITELKVVLDMHTRKKIMFENSDGFVILPGGFGTLEETFEVMTWKQIGLHDKPIVIVNGEGFWDPLRHLLDHLVEQKFTAPTDAKLYHFVETPEEVIPTLKKLPRTMINPTTKWI